MDDLLKRYGGGTVQVGFPVDDKYPTGVGVPQAAWWAEYGHGGHFPTPPRPYFRSMIAKESPGWPQALAGALQATGDTTAALGSMGQRIGYQLRDSIIGFDDVPLSKTTLRLRYKYTQKQFDEGVVNTSAVLQAQQDVRDGMPIATGTGAKPLVHSGLLLRNVAYVVNRGEAKKVAS